MRPHGHDPMNFEFLISQRPLSLQAKPSRLRKWKEAVRSAASECWEGDPINQGNLCLTLVYLCGLLPPDADNIVKPIQDALKGLVYSDDVLVADVDCHRRFLDEGIDITHLPSLLITAAGNAVECVYVRVSTSLELGDYL
jgi:crossover junction endodeoxyribonuclease RusA